MKILRSIKLNNENGCVSIVDAENEIIIKREVSRNGLSIPINFCEFIDKDGNSQLKKLNLDLANKILDKIENGEDYSSAYIFSEINGDEYVFEKSEMEHKYTSTGIKFWRHKEQMESYRSGSSNCVISTHISPEGACNLKCPYCSVTYRDTHSRIELEVIQDYVTKLKTRGLKAVILTGGGEPTLYKKFNELVRWLKFDQNLSVALITNGTNSQRVDDKTWTAFSWVRVSINMFEGWETKISLPYQKLNTDCIVGASTVMTFEHQKIDDKYMDKVVMLKKISEIADKINAKYVRILPNCLLQQDKLILMHKNIEKTLGELNDKRFFHQHKLHNAPKCSTCHQAYFRPYLSEEPFFKNNKPGSVYPCDSVVLNNGNQRFLQKYQLCSASDILEFLDKKIQMRFDPRIDCSGCVFTSNVNMLDDWVNKGVNKFDIYQNELKHEEFV
jgi:MoaA/NifB/PqqE/SkfB family radical SAM enzyme